MKNKHLQFREYVTPCINIYKVEPASSELINSSVTKVVNSSTNDDTESLGYGEDITWTW